LTERPRVSVLLPAWNAERTLAPALRSVQRQTEPRLELVLVDDGSTDATARLAHRFAASDPRIRILSIPHRGLVAALNHGLGACRAPFVARMDADDVMHRERLARQLDALNADPKLAAVGCHVRLFPRSALADGMRRYERWLNAIDSPERVRAEAFVECPIAHPTWLLRADVLHAFGYRDRGWPEDYDLLLRLLAAGHVLDVVPRRLHAWRLGDMRLSRRNPAYGVDAFVRCKAEFIADGFLSQTESYVLWGYGDTGRALRKALLVHGKRPERIVELHPGRLGNRIHGAEVVPPAALAKGARRPLVVSVAGDGPRHEIRSALSDMGFQEGPDYLCAA